jgi:class 3 adenylate cyclase/tetratricopeptide (TPR) repeat protein
MAVCTNCGREAPDGFAFCGHCGAALVSAPPRDIRKTVTVLFADVVGSTSLGETRDPEQVRSQMAGWFERARRTIELHGGTVEKFVGDAVMAVFGVPVVREDDALRAVRAAHELRAPEFRIGVNTGEVVAGAGETLVTGDAVNLAARLEQTAAPGEVLIGRETQRLVRDAVQIEPLTPLEVKGKTAPVEAFRLLEVREAAAGVARRLDTPLVGRRRELDRLHRDFEHAVAERRCHLITLLGSAGVGKTRLTAAFLEDLDARVLRGRCLHYGEGITYFPLVEVLLQLGIEPDSVIGSSTAETQLAFRKLLEREAADEPIVVQFDDLQWAEPAFLDLVEHIADLSRGAPMFLLCIARPELLEVRPAWGGGKLNATTIFLEPLSEDECEQLIAELGGADDDLRTRVVAASQGNPLFVEEMLAMLREGDGEVAVPPTIRALLEARLDTLGRDERDVVERGAVEGELFHRRVVVELAPEIDVDAQLPSLVRKELIRPDTPVFADDDAYRFRHLLIRDAAYEALPKETRAELHERFASWLEEHAQLVEQDEIVGYHLEQAALYRQELGDPDAVLARRAAERLAAAGRGARDRGDGHAAMSLMDRAASLLPPGHPLRLECRLASASSLVLAARLADAKAAIAEVSASPDERMRALAAIAELELSFHAGGLELERGRERVAAATQTLRGYGEAEDLAYAALVAGGIEWYACRLGAARTWTEAALAHADQAGSPWFEARALSELFTLMIQGPMPISETEHELERLRARAKGRPALEASLAASRAGCARLRSDFEEARQLTLKAIARREELGERVYAVSGRGFALGSIAWLRGDYAEAERLFREAHVQLSALGERGFAPTLALAIAEALAKQGRDTEAATYLEEMRELTNPGDVANDIEGISLESVLVARRGECERALALGERALERVLDTDAFNLRFTTFELVAETLVQCGRKDGARELRERMVAEAEVKEATGYADRARALVAEL